MSFFFFGGGGVNREIDFVPFVRACARGEEGCYCASFREIVFFCFPFAHVLAGFAQVLAFGLAWPCPPNFLSPLAGLYEYCACVCQSCHPWGMQKGLHDCNSPMCTLSQNGYGASQGARMRSRRSVEGVQWWHQLATRMPQTQNAVARSGSATCRCCCSGPVAQWIRHRPTEPGIAGSSPAGVIFASQQYYLHACSRQTRPAQPKRHRGDLSPCGQSPMDF